MFKKIKNDSLNFLLLFVCFFIAFYSRQDIKLSFELFVPEEIKTHQLGEVFYSYTGFSFTAKQRFTFHYNQYPEKNFTIQATLPRALELKQIRFDPLTTSGTIRIKKIWIEMGFEKRQISLKKLYENGSISAIKAIDKLEIDRNELVITTKGSDPYLLLIADLQSHINIQQIWLENAALSICLAFLGMLLLHFYRFAVLHFKLTPRLPKKLLLLDIKHPKHTLLFALILLAFSIVVSKTFTSIVATFRFNRDLSLADYFFTYITDLEIAVILSGLALLATLLSQILANKKLQEWVITAVTFLLKQLKNVLNVTLFLLSIALVGLAIYYFVSAYVFYEWGGFVEYQHLEMAGHAEVDSEFFDLILQWKTFFFTLAFFVLLLITAKVVTRIPQASLLKTLRALMIIFLPLALLAWYPLNLYQFKPSVQSPVLMLQKQTNGYNVPKHLLTQIDKDDFIPTPLKPLPEQYKKYDSVAKGMNLIIVMMESVRQQNIDLYGYHRKTMPNLTKMAEHGLVFHNAYVNQPRSSKTMESFSLGIYPDPRLPAISWRHEQIKTKDSLFKRFTDQGYLFYYGTMQRMKDTESFASFLHKISGYKMSHVTDLTDIYNMRPVEDEYPKESILTEDLLQWSSKQTKPFVGFMWTQCAHMPYDSPVTPFGTDTKTDKYDNCLTNLDNNLAVLTAGLKAQGKLDNTLIMIAGDHGEALGEHLDWGHGNYLYEHSLRYPAVFYSPKIFNEQIDLTQRFQFKDFSATLLYLFGLPDPDTLGQSVNIFRKTDNDPIYLSNVYLDYKLGLIYDHFKFVYRPKYNITYLYDLTADPEENINIIETISKKEAEALRIKVLTWYKYQIKYVNNQVF